MILAELVNANARLGQPQSYVSFYRPAYLSGLAYTLLGLNAVITWVKTLKYLNQFPHLSMVRPMTLLALGSARLTSACAQLSLTLRNAYYPTVAPPPPPRALPDSCALTRADPVALGAGLLPHHVLHHLPGLRAGLQYGCAQPYPYPHDPPLTDTVPVVVVRQFGPYMKSYSDFPTSMMSLFRALLGEFEYEEMQKTDEVVGPLLFLTFMLLVLFVLVNMFIAILSEACASPGNPIHKARAAGSSEWFGRPDR